MPIKKRVLLLFLICIFSIHSTGCSVPSLHKLIGGGSEEDLVVSGSDYKIVSSEEEILSVLLHTMQNNRDKSYFCVPEESMINADLWLAKLTGIKSVQCEYHSAKDGYYVTVSLSYWDNYPLVNAYKTGNTSFLTPKQLELYNKYLSIIKDYTHPSADPWVNELAIHDYLVNNLEYTDQSDSVYNAYDALINGRAVCNGYTECFKTFMDMLDIECLAVPGKAGNELHIWNMVKLNGAWYHVDVTWDDPINGDGTVEHGYFNVSDADILLDHTWDLSAHPRASGIVYTYPYIKRIPSVLSQSELNSFILTELQKESKIVEFTVTGTADLKTAVEKGGIRLSYSYKKYDRAGYTLYKVVFAYK